MLERFLETTAEYVDLTRLRTEVAADRDDSQAYSTASPTAAEQDCRNPIASLETGISAPPNDYCLAGIISQ